MTTSPEIDGQLSFFDAPAPPVQLELELATPRPDGLACHQCGATSDLLWLTSADQSVTVAACRLPGVCGLNQSMAAAGAAKRAVIDGE